MFLGFGNLYIRFIKNFSRIAASLILILQTTNDEALSTQAIEDKKNEAASASAGSIGGGDANSEFGGNIKNLSTVANLAKTLKLTKPKKSRLSNAKANSGTDFLTSGAKKAFIYL